METEPDFSDFSMIELFKSDVGLHSAALNDGLLMLESDPTATDNIDALMRAAHSIKGAARIVELDSAAEVAHIMEDCFVAAQKGQILFTPNHIDRLLKGADTLKAIGEVASEEMAEWLAGHQEDIVQTIARIEAILDTTAGDPKPRSKEEMPKKEPKPVRQVPETEPTPLPKLARQAAPIDTSMLELFKTEVETHAVTLNDGLLALETDPTATDNLEAMMRAAHSIKGAARIMELDTAAEVAHIMEDCFVAAQKGAIAFSSDHIDVLLKGADTLKKISEVAGEGVKDWLAQQQADIAQTVSQLNTIVSPGSATHAAAPTRLQPAAEPSVAFIPVRSGEEQNRSLVESERAIAARVSEVKPYHRAVTDADRMVRVTAGKIERLMGQAGEVVVGARWLEPFSQSMLELKKGHMDLSFALEELREVMEGEGETLEPTKELLVQTKEKTKACGLLLAEKMNELEIFRSTTANLSDRLYHEVVGVRMRPFSDGTTAFPRMVRDLARDLGKKVTLNISGKSTEVDRDILEKLDAPLTHLLRNAVDHGIETPEERIRQGKPEAGIIQMEAVHRAGMLMITIADDGKGVDHERLRQQILKKNLADAIMVENLTEAEIMDFLFLPGFSTSDRVTEISGRGVGLDVVRDMVHGVGGIVRAESRPGQGLRFHLELPLTLSVVRTFLVEIESEPYAFPLGRIDRCLILSPEDIETVEDRQYFRFDGDNIALISFHEILGTKALDSYDGRFHVVVVSDRMNSYGLLVDKFLGEYDLVVRPLDRRLGKVPDISAVAVMLDGSPVLIFDVEDVVRSIDNLLGGRRLKKVEGSAGQIEERPRKRILVVDDSITVREMERKLLENRGYQVDVAVDGMDGWNAVRTGQFDLVVTDVDMPRMNGLELITNIKRHSSLRSLPVIIVSYKDRDEDRMGGLDAGANYYLTKSSFRDESFMTAVVDLIGKA